MRATSFFRPFPKTYLNLNHVQQGKNMSLQERDYYWNNNRPSKRKKPDNPLKHLLLPTFIIALLCLAAGWRFFDFKLSKTPFIPSKPDTLPRQTVTSQDIIVLNKDQQGHFRGTARVNGTLVPFLIDTGATKTVIPKGYARKANLLFGQRITSSTAGGKVTSRMTNIPHLQIGNITLKNIPANINNHLNEALIGMNTLKYFEMTQKGNTLTLKPNRFNGQIQRQHQKVSYKPQLNHPQTYETYKPKKTTRIIHRVKCSSTPSGKKTCTTHYSDR
jgi:aspartyl protease family protein